MGCHYSLEEEERGATRVQVEREEVRLWSSFGVGFVGVEAKEGEEDQTLSIGWKGEGREGMPQGGLGREPKATPKLHLGRKRGAIMGQKLNERLNMRGE